MSIVEAKKDIKSDQKVSSSDDDESDDEEFDQVFLSFKNVLIFFHVLLSILR